MDAKSRDPVPWLASPPKILSSLTIWPIFSVVHMDKLSLLTSSAP
jgi:hypothetical protein